MLMEPDLTGHAGTRSSPASRNGDALDELDWLNVRVRRQPIEIDSLRAEVSIPLGDHAPGIARSVIVRSLGDHVPRSALDDAQLVVSELVTNSVCHSNQGEHGHVIVRVRLWRSTCRIEVEDPGWDGVIEPLTPDPKRGTGLGLNLVQMLSESWGIVRAPRGPTRVWAQLSCGPALA
jgi:anti-sigma regulatory factor (Ser/Thr protein kinase)